MITLIATIRSAHKRMHHSIWLGKTCSASLTVHRHITDFKCLTNNQSNSLHSTSRVEHLHTEDWHKDLVVPYQHFRASSAKISIQSKRPNIVQNTLMIQA